MTTYLTCFWEERRRSNADSTRPQQWQSTEYRYWCQEHSCVRKPQRRPHTSTSRYPRKDWAHSCPVRTQLWSDKANRSCSSTSEKMHPEKIGTQYNIGPIANAITVLSYEPESLATLTSARGNPTGPLFGSARCEYASQRKINKTTQFASFSHLVNISRDNRSTRKYIRST